MTDRTVGPKARALMRHFETCSLLAYLCPANVWTIGWGNTYYLDGRKVQRGDRITQAEADALFEAVLDRDFAQPVSAAIGDVPTTPAQFGAMVALAYNIGMGPRIRLPGMKPGFRQSEVLRLHRAGQYDAAALAFGGWTKAGGKVSKGLVRRRAAEAALYRGQMSEVARLTMGDLR